jgi:hypothetical protein
MVISPTARHTAAASGSFHFTAKLLQLYAVPWAALICACITPVAPFEAARCGAWVSLHPAVRGICSTASIRRARVATELCARKGGTCAKQQTDIDLEEWADRMVLAYFHDSLSLAEGRIADCPKC